MKSQKAWAEGSRIKRIAAQQKITIGIDLRDGKLPKMHVGRRWFGGQPRTGADHKNGDDKAFSILPPCGVVIDVGTHSP